jgi:L-ascorbate oxidase
MLILQTILINGRGQYDCMLGKVTNYYRGIHKYAKTCVRGKEAKLCKDEERCLRRSECGPYCPKSQCAPVVFDVEPGKTYRLRIASTTSLSALNLQVEGVRKKPLYYLLLSFFSGTVVVKNVC